MGEISGGDIARTADPNRPKGYSIPYDVCSAIKAKRKKEDGGAFIVTFVFQSNFPESGWTSPADGK